MAEREMALKEPGRIKVGAVKGVSIRGVMDSGEAAHRSTRPAL